MKTKKPKTVGSQIIKGLTELAEALENGEHLEKRFTVRTVELAPKPAAYTPADLIRTRSLLGTSQSVFASIMGVSTTLVQHWEQGIRKPSAMACRLLDEINREPKRWVKLIQPRKSA